MILKKPTVRVVFLLALLASCGPSPRNDVPVIGFVDAFEDVSLAAARKGFTDALRERGFSEDKKTLKIIYRNAQGDIPALTQIVNYFISRKVTLIATCPTLSTITAVQRNKTIPVFMMVSPVPGLMKIEDSKGRPPANLFGTAEELAYIDTSFSLIPQLVRIKKGSRLAVGMIYNQAEPQSVDALNRIKMLAGKMAIDLIALPVNNSSEAQLVTRALLAKGVDAFFANPDNTVFASFDIIVKTCDDNGVPVFTSEAGLVKRGAVAAFGADIYKWGRQTGEQAAGFLQTGKTPETGIEMVKVRERVFNAKAGRKFGIGKPAGFSLLGN